MIPCRDPLTFDHVLRTVLHERVRGEEPSARIRLDVLCAAAARRALPTDALLESETAGFPVAATGPEESGQPPNLRSRLLVDMLSAQMLGVRFAV